MMMHCRTVVICLFLFAATPVAYGQPEKLDPERPGESQSAANLSKRHFEFEAGVQFEKDSVTLHQVSEPEVLLRYGISDKIELRLRGEFLTVTHKANGRAQHETGLLPVEPGVKVGL